MFLLPNHFPSSTVPVRALCSLWHNRRPPVACVYWWTDLISALARWRDKVTWPATRKQRGDRRGWQRGRAMPRSNTNKLSTHKFRKIRIKNRIFSSTTKSENCLLEVLYVRPLPILHRIQESTINRAVCWQLAKSSIFGSFGPYYTFCFKAMWGKITKNSRNKLITWADEAIPCVTFHRYAVKWRMIVEVGLYMIDEWAYIWLNYGPSAGSAGIPLS
jgi:hypothetical protein